MGLTRKKLLEEIEKVNFSDDFKQAVTGAALRMPEAGLNAAQAALIIDHMLAQKFDPDAIQNEPVETLFANLKAPNL